MLMRILSKMVQPGSRWSGRQRLPTRTAAVQQRAALLAQQAQIRRAVIDALPANIALLDADGVIVLVNHAWQCFANANALGCADFGVGMNYLQVCEQVEEAVATALGIRQVLTRALPIFHIEYPCHSPTEERWFELIAAPLEDVHLAGAMLSHVNITLRKLAERNMLAGAQRLADAQRIAHMGSWEFDLLTMRAMLSDEMCRLSYCKAFGEEIDCADFLALAHPEDYNKLACAVLPGSDAAPQLSLEYRTHPALGPVRLLSAIIHLVCNAEGRVIRTHGTAQDISERRQINLKLQRDAERLQHLSRRLMASEEEERRRIGRDLHDQTGSNLTAITLNLQILRSKLLPWLTMEIKQRLDDLESLLYETILHIRDMLANLRPPALDEFGVLAALRYYVQGVAARSGLKLEIAGHEPSPRLPPEVEIALFRIAQEAVTNVLKHAHARCVTITLASDSTCLRFLVQDDGCGFDCDCDSNLLALGSLGMTTMQERAQAIGAQLRLHSTIGVGTRISVELDHGVANKSCNTMEGSAP